jgi:hypothetical protein
LTAVLVILGNGAVDWRYHQLMVRSPGSNLWSTAIYNLNDLLTARYSREG